jgi:carboxymethylenebutenolidase
MKVFLNALLLVTFPVAVQAQDWARESLSKSPRHHEWVQVKHDDRVVHAFVAYPEVKKKSPAVVLIHENQGLTDWVRSVADQLAAAGYVAIAPDLLSGTQGKEKTSDFENADAARKAISQLNMNQVTADLNAVTDFVKKLPAASGKVAVAGFCWGGARTFAFAKARPDISAAFVFYGTGPEDVSGIKGPVFGFYGENDARVNATIQASAQQMKDAKLRFEPVIYKGAGHGFMRTGEDPNGGADDKQARKDAWARWLKLLKSM